VDTWFEYMCKLCVCSCTSRCNEDHQRKNSRRLL